MDIVRLQHWHFIYFLLILGTFDYDARSFVKDSILASAVKKSADMYDDPFYHKLLKMVMLPPDVVYTLDSTDLGYLRIDEDDEDEDEDDEDEDEEDEDEDDEDEDVDEENEDEKPRKKSRV